MSATRTCGSIFSKVLPELLRLVASKVVEEEDASTFQKNEYKTKYKMEMTDAANSKWFFAEVAWRTPFSQNPKELPPPQICK